MFQITQHYTPIMVMQSSYQKLQKQICHQSQSANPLPPAGLLWLTSPSPPQPKHPKGNICNKSAIAPYLSQHPKSSRSRAPLEVLLCPGTQPHPRTPIPSPVLIQALSCALSWGWLAKPAPQKQEKGRHPQVREWLQVMFPLTLAPLWKMRCFIQAFQFPPRAVLFILFCSSFKHSHPSPLSAGNNKEQHSKFAGKGNALTIHK